MMYRIILLAMLTGCSSLSDATVADAGRWIAPDDLTVTRGWGDFSGSGHDSLTEDETAISLTWHLVPADVRIVRSPDMDVLHAELMRVADEQEKARKLIDERTRPAPVPVESNGLFGTGIPAPVGVGGAGLTTALLLWFLRDKLFKNGKKE